MRWQHQQLRRRRRQPDHAVHASAYTRTFIFSSSVCGYFWLLSLHLFYLRRLYMYEARLLGSAPLPLATYSGCSAILLLSAAPRPEPSDSDTVWSATQTRFWQVRGGRLPRFFSDTNSVIVLPERIKTQQNKILVFFLLPYSVRC